MPSHLNAVLYASFGLYCVIFLVASVQFMRSCVRYRAWTTQKWVHLLIAVGSAARASFLLMGTRWWDGAHGQVLVQSMTGLQHELFYVLDEMSNLLFLLVYAAVVLFWARVCCVSMDRCDMFDRVVRPITTAGVALVGVGHVAVWIVYGISRRWRRDATYVRREYAIFSGSSCLLLAAALLVFGCKVYRELRAVPVDLRVRMMKAREVGVVTGTWTVCFTLRAALMIWAAQKGPVLTGSSAYLILVFYFDVLEGAPLCVALYFHRRMPLWLRDASSLNSNGGSASKGLVNAQHERLLASDEKDGLLTAHSPSPSPPLG